LFLVLGRGAVGCNFDERTPTPWGVERKKMERMDTETVGQRRPKAERFRSDIRDKTLKQNELPKEKARARV